MAFSRWFPGPYRRDAGGDWPARVSCLPAKHAQAQGLPTPPPSSRVVPAMRRRMESCRRGGQRSASQRRGSTLPGRIERLLRDGEASTSTLAARAGVTPRAVRKHLSALIDAGVVIRLDGYRYALAPRIITLEH